MRISDWSSDVCSSDLARSVMYQTAVALERSDKGDTKAKVLARILTPLIKFRACRDARKVTGDAMEVRGGCGYIEEWTEPRLLRDAHLGRSEEHTSELQSLMRISYAVFCLNKTKIKLEKE